MSKIRCLLTALLLASAPALAQPAADGPTDREERSEQRFKQADRNNDGRLTLEEMEAARAARRAERFAKMDTNRDGGVTREELQAAHREHREHRKARRHERREGMREKMHARLQALDTDQDQALTKAELGDAMPRLAGRFDAIDTNKDGKLTREEMRAARPKHRDGHERPR